MDCSTWKFIKEDRMYQSFSIGWVHFSGSIYVNTCLRVGYAGL